jgi:hypothetical protein
MVAEFAAAPRRPRAWQPGAGPRRRLLEQECTCVADEALSALVAPRRELGEYALALLRHVFGQKIHETSRCHVLTRASGGGELPGSDDGP